MPTRKLTNITISQYKEFLTNAGCKKIRTKGGHETWSHTAATRPITFQTHIDPVPEFIIKNALKTLGLSRVDFFRLLPE